MTGEYSGITPEELLKSADPRLAADLMARTQSAFDQAERMRQVGHESVCVASTIAFTHYGVVGNFDFSHGVTIRDMAGSENHEGIAAQAARFAHERVDMTDFHGMDPLDKGKLKRVLNGVHSAWVSIVPSISGGGHTLGVVPGRHSREFIAWDTAGNVPMLVPITLDGLLQKVNGNFKEFFHGGTIFSFR